MHDINVIDLYTNKAKDERTVMKKNNFKKARRITIDVAHTEIGKTKPKHDLLKQVNNVGYTLSTTVRILVHILKCNNQQVIFDSKPTVAIFFKRDDATTTMYNLGADHHYMSKADSIGLVFPILLAS